MCDTGTVRDENAAAFDADTGATERFAHFRERARTIVEEDAEVFHERISAR